MNDSLRQHDRDGSNAPETFAVECPVCRAHVAVKRDLVGRAAGCPTCRGAFMVPPAETAARAPRPAAPRPPVAATAEPAHATAASAHATAEPAHATAEPIRAAATPAVRDEPVVFADPPLPSTRCQHVEPAVAADVATAGPVAVTTGPQPGPEIEVGARLPEATEPDDGAAFSFPEPVRTIRSGDAEIELRRLTPEERRTRRARRNLLILVVGAALLVALVVILGKGVR